MRNKNQIFSMYNLRNFMIKNLFHNSTGVFHRYRDKDKDKDYEYDDCEDDTYRV